MVHFSRNCTILRAQASMLLSHRAAATHHTQTTLAALLVVLVVAVTAIDAISADNDGNLTLIMNCLSIYVLISPTTDMSTACVTNCGRYGYIAAACPWQHEVQDTEVCSKDHTDELEAEKSPADGDKL